MNSHGTDVNLIATCSLSISARVQRIVLITVFVLCVFEMELYEVERPHKTHGYCLKILREEERDLKKQPIFDRAQYGDI